MNTNTTKRRRVRFILITLLALAAASVAMCAVWRLDTEPRTDDAFVYADTIGVMSEVSGRIIDLPVRDNQAVKCGDVLFRIDARPFQEALRKSQANLASLDSEIALTQRSVNAQKLGADAAKANVDKARAIAVQARDTYRRLEPLLGRGYVSAEQVDQARTAERTAQAQLGVALLDAQKAAAGVGGVDALVAKREAVKAELELARLNLEFTVVHAPFDGRVIGLRTFAGQFAAAGHPVFTLANTSRWYVIANFRETDLAQMAPGRAAQVYIMSDSSKRFKGVVESVGFGVFPDDGGGETAGLPHVPRSINWVRVAQRFPVRILVDNPDPSLFRIGASAVAMIADKNSVAK